MLISQGDARSVDADRRLACTLAAVAGALNAAAFQAVGFFSANMTGNVSALSAHLAVNDLLTAAFYLSIVAAFIGGALVSTLLINLGRRRRVHAIYAFSILVEAVLLALLGCADLWLSASLRGPVLIVGLSFLMGLQNATVTRISDARVRTTHVSGMVTDIGIELGMLVDIARGRERADAPYHTRLRLHGQTVLAFLAGGVVGVFVYRMVGGFLLIGAAGLLLALASTAILRVHRTPNAAASPSPHGAD
ncbi:YoaK family protein [Caulobacter sp. S45]|uniref:YoaK family protein n=1 Tax=Caulobacter sp. S45 TaxID=1641861 RepID=UPI00131BA1A8|nr:YoaK family protein [Caulobacter sp. S45]